MFSRLLPFLRWFPSQPGQMKADLVAGITVALVLIPQSMAYAQLAGMPAYYGLYAGFLPVVIAALWGSSNQLATGPVAVVSLLTASSLATLAPPGSDQFIALAVMLALLVGAIQLTLGVFKLGVVVNFLSHPVIVGFTNAAAIIIGLSQVNKLIGVPMGRSEHFIEDIWGVVKQVGDTHLPSLAMGAVAIAIIWFVRKKAPRYPGVLIAVVVTTLASWQIGFERTATVSIEAIADGEARNLLADFSRTEARIGELEKSLSALQSQQRRLSGALSREAVTLDHEIDLLRLQLDDRRHENRGRNRAIRSLVFERVAAADGQPEQWHAAGRLPPGAAGDGRLWRIKRVSGDELRLSGGGDVVGSIPEGLPALTVPSISWDMAKSLLSAALVISLVGFMEAISIAKAMAAKTRDRIDPSQELVGQGLANIAGAFTQSFPVSGSFSRSAVNLNAGAKTGMSAVFTGAVVLLTLLFLTPLLYHLPQAVLAAVIIMAVIGLVNFAAMHQAWQANRHDGVASNVTFVATLAFAPHLDKGIIVGAGLAIVLYLLRTMKPRVAILARHPDGTLRDRAVFPDLPRSESVIALRFDGRLYFANVPYFEDAVLEAVATHPRARVLLIVGDAINEVDASGEEVIGHLVERLRANGIKLVFSGLKRQVLDVMRATGLDRRIGEGCLLQSEDAALDAIAAEIGEAEVAPLRLPAVAARSSPPAST